MSPTQHDHLLQPASIDYSGKKILAIDDSKPNIDLLTFALEKKGFEVTSSLSASDGLRKLEDCNPDLILLDIDLPDESGIEVCKKIKARDECRSVPVIFITAHGDSKTLVKGFEAGAADYIIKPLKLPEVIARIKTHLKVQHLMRLEKEYNTALKQANIEINKLLGITTHDLRNPLVSIRGLTEFLQESEVTKEQRELLDTIHSASETLLFLIENLLDYASVESSVIALDRKESKLEELIQKAIRLHSITSEKKGITLKLKTSSKEINPVFIDDKRMSQVIDNLITNAIKFSPFKTQVTISIEQNKDSTIMYVDDQGPGIPEKEMDKLFTTFGKTSVRPTNNEQSTGLGLVICRKIIESHAGSITAGKNNEGGARFTVTLNNIHHDRA